MRKVPDDFISIIIVTYNRGYLIKRALDSIKKQTVSGFTVIIVDDGSTDNTKAIVEDFIKETSYRVNYIYKENGGVHTARNVGVQNCTTEFFYMLDSDDEIIEDTIEFLYTTWAGFSEQEKRKYQLGISGLTMTTPDGKICGGYYSKKVNEHSVYAAQREYLKGERCEMRSTKIYRDEFPYLEIDGLKHVPEGIRNDEILTKYRFYLVNKVFRRYYFDAVESFSKGMKNLDLTHSMFVTSMYKVNHYYPSIHASMYQQICSYIGIVRFGLADGNKVIEILGEIKSCKNKLFVMLCFPVGIWLWKHKPKKINEK